MRTNRRRTRRVFEQAEKGALRGSLTESRFAADRSPRRTILAKRGNPAGIDGHTRIIERALRFREKVEEEFERLAKTAVSSPHQDPTPARTEGESINP